MAKAVRKTKKAEVKKDIEEVDQQQESEVLLEQLHLKVKEIKYSDFFKNRKTLPVKGTDAFNKLVKEEEARCLGGVMVDGVYFSGWLYWHLNHWWIRDDIEDDYSNIVRGKLLPSLRDNEWIVSEYLEQCRLEKKGYLHIGVRQFGKSEIMASYQGYHATLFQNTQNVIVGGNDSDLSLLKDKIDFGLKNVWEGLKIPMLDKDWRKPMVRLGIKAKNNDDEVWSYIMVRNVADGKNTEGPAGVTAKAYATDEIGKFPFAQSFEAAKPAFKSKFGWRCVPLLFGTGGSFEKGADAERFFYHPDANNFLAVTDPQTGERTCVFMSGLYRLDCKYETTLGDYLRAEGKIKHQTKDLDLITFHASDKIKALTLIKEERANKATDPDQTEYLKLIMYYPLTPRECFLSSSENYFNTDIARNQKDRLETQFPGLRVGMYIDLYEEEGLVKHKPSIKLPVMAFPRNAKENTDCPVVILEHPVPDPPYGLYVAGIDPYRFAKAVHSDSLGAVYIFKRSYDALSDSFQDMPVAWYVARPESKDTWNNTARMLIKYYNATALCENDEMSFIDYMIAKGEGHMLMDTPDWIKEYSPNSSANLRQKGVSSSPRNIELFNTNLKQYMEEHFTSVAVGTSEETKKILGVAKIYDPVFLDEVIKWNKDGNFDRIRALSIAITCARKMDLQRIQVTIEDIDPRFKEPDMKRRKSSGVFKQLDFHSTIGNNRFKRLFK